MTGTATALVLARSQFAFTVSFHFIFPAFFLEAGFLGVMLFGLNKVGPKLHFLATCMVALGTLLSATWILAANSWMQTPSGWKNPGR
jgi:cytochrome d ubiquinol oxidase subunit I